MTPRNLFLTAGLATVCLMGAGAFMESSGQEAITGPSDRVEWYVRLKGTKA